MLLDAKLAFVPVGAPLSLVAAVGVAIPSTNVIDLIGPGVGQPMANFTGNAALPGQADGMGVGMMRPELVVAIGTALVAGTGTPTLNVQLQGAPDNGANLPGTYTTFGESGEITVAQGIANRVIARLPWLPPWPFNSRPRFLRLNFAVPAAVNFSAGTIAYAVVSTVRDDPYHLQAAKNYTVAPFIP